MSTALRSDATQHVESPFRDSPGDPVTDVICPYRGAAHALITRAKNLADLILLAKQYIYTLRQSAESSISAHRSQSQLLSTKILSSRDLNSLFSHLDGHPTSRSSVLLGPNGLSTELDRLSRCNHNTSIAFQELFDPETSFRSGLPQLNQQSTEINDFLKTIKEHQRVEEDLCTHARGVSKAIHVLRLACRAPSTSTPEMDPFSLRVGVQIQMQRYLIKELDYAKRVCAHQTVLKSIEKTVFEIFSALSRTHGAIMIPLMNKCNEFLERVEDSKFEFASDWNAFESQHDDLFARHINPTKETSEDDPSDAIFLKYLHVSELQLEIYDKVPRQVASHVENSLLQKIRWATNKATPTKHEYQIRGEWLVSKIGTMIQVDESRRILSTFNLRKCQIGKLVPDSECKYGLFTLRGPKLSGQPDGKNRGKKEYKFRLPWVKSLVFHTILSAHCNATAKCDVGDTSSSTLLSSGETTMVTE
jgi:hypothetical protein